MDTKRAALGGLLLLACDTSAQAHHSRAMFDLRQPRTLTGTVREFQWTNPHCYIQLTVRDAAGRDEEWSVEMGSPIHLQGRGWGKRTLRPGDRVTVTVSPLRNGRNGGEFVTATTADGRPLGRQA
jgi:hypothetical protein